MTCVTYKNKPCKDWWKIFKNDTQVQFEVGCLVEKRFFGKGNRTRQNWGWLGLGLQLHSSRRLLSKVALIVLLQFFGIKIKIKKGRTSASSPSHCSWGRASKLLPQGGALKYCLVVASKFISCQIVYARSNTSFHFKGETVLSSIDHNQMHRHKFLSEPSEPGFKLKWVTV